MSSYETALKLASITGRPLTDFYKQDITGKCSCGSTWNEYGVCNGTHEENKQAEKIQVEKRESLVKAQDAVHLRENGNKEKESKNKIQRQDVSAELLAQYGGEVVNGKILRARQMTRKEYLETKRKFKSVDEFWKSPLLYVMFRSEGQQEASFVHWTSAIEKELEKRCKT